MAKKTQSSGLSADVIHLPADVIKRAKDLLTAAEKKFFDSSFGSNLAKATHEQVQAAGKQARVLRDKWRDLYQEQARSSKRQGKPAAGDVNVRTQHKHELFAGAVERFEKRLADLKGSVTAAASRAKATAKPATAKPAAAKSAAPAKSAAIKKAPAKKAVVKTAVSKTVAAVYAKKSSPKAR